MSGPTDGGDAIARDRAIREYATLHNVSLHEAAGRMAELDKPTPVNPGPKVLPNRGRKMPVRRRPTLAEHEQQVNELMGLIADRGAVLESYAAQLKQLKTHWLAGWIVAAAGWLTVIVMVVK